MGFHKRWLMNDSLIDMYRNRGINAIAEWVDGADALMAEEGLASKVIDLLHEEQFNSTEIWRANAETFVLCRVPSRLTICNSLMKSSFFGYCTMNDGCTQ